MEKGTGDLGGVPFPCVKPRAHLPGGLQTITNPTRECAAFLQTIDISPAPVYNLCKRFQGFPTFCCLISFELAYFTNHSLESRKRFQILTRFPVILDPSP